jgi:hypothetical protein
VRKDEENVAERYALIDAVIDTPRMSDKPDEAVLNAHDQIVQSAVFRTTA